jgi:SAM-dependent MidA family methyltransferase
VETSPVLRTAQRERLPHAQWHADLQTLPQKGPILAVANEFFDALPIRQLIRTERTWNERLVAWRDDGFVPIPGPPFGSQPLPAHLQEAPPGSIVETSPASAAVIGQLAHLIAQRGGAALIIDYGHDRTSPGDTLQAVSKHAFADPWVRPGECDLTAHVDFEALASAATREGARIYGPIGQGAFLTAVGIEARAAALATAAPARAAEIKATRARLTAPDQMGELFRVLAIVAPDWPEPAGFA